MATRIMGFGEKSQYALTSGVAAVPAAMGAVVQAVVGAAAVFFMAVPLARAQEGGPAELPPRKKAAPREPREAEPPKSISAAIRTLTQGKAPERVKAVWVIARLKGSKCPKVLIHVLGRDPSPVVRMAAMAAMGPWLTVRDLPSLRRALKAEKDEGVRQPLATHIRKLETKTATTRKEDVATMPFQPPEDRPEKRKRKKKNTSWFFVLAGGPVFLAWGAGTFLFRFGVRYKWFEWDLWLQYGEGRDHCSKDGLLMFHTGLWGYSYRGNWVRIRHGVHGGMIGAWSEQIRSTRDCDTEFENYEGGWIFVNGTANVLDTAIRLGSDHVWLEISPFNFTFPAVMWYGLIGIRFET